MLRRSQRESIITHLKEGLEITPLDALEQYGIFRLSAIIFNLKKEGYNIATKRVKNRYGKKFASYKLIKEDLYPDYRTV